MWGRLPSGHGHRRLALAVFFGSVLCNAALGIAGLAGNGFGDTEGKLFATSLSVTAALLLGLLCLPAWERGLLGVVPAVSALAAGVGFALVVASIWSEAGDLMGRVVATVLVPAGAGVLASLVALARLAPRHRFIVHVSYVLSVLAVVAILVQVWASPATDALGRVIGVLLVLLGALVVSIPVIHRLDGMPEEHEPVAVLQPVDPKRVAFCPRCGAPVAGTLGEPVACGRCGAGFVVREG